MTKIPPCAKFQNHYLSPIFKVSDEAYFSALPHSQVFCCSKYLFFPDIDTIDPYLQIFDEWVF